MTTTIQDLCLKNFGPYRDEHKLDLSVTPNAPVVLIFGENTLGKSQLFSALRWCLYGTSPLTKAKRQREWNCRSGQ